MKNLTSNFVRGLRLVLLLLIQALILVSVSSSAASPLPAQGTDFATVGLPPDAFSTPASDPLMAKAQGQGDVHVIVGLRVTFQPEGDLANSQAVHDQRTSIAQAQAALLNQMSAYNVTSIKTFPFIPYLAMAVDAAGLGYLQSSPDVTSIEEDVLLLPTLAES